MPAPESTRATALPGGAITERREAAAPRHPTVTTVQPRVAAVSFTCPRYRTAIYPTGDGGSSPDYRGPGDYSVRFSPSPARDANGALTQTSTFGGIRSARAAADGQTCTAALDSFEGPTYPAAIGRRVYWQVYRYCNGCIPQDEKGPVRSFVVRPARIAARLVAPARVYAGYPALYSVTSRAKNLDGTIRLQYRRGGRWRTLAHEGVATGRTELIASLPAGRRTLRALLATKSYSQIIATLTLTARSAQSPRQTSARDDGSYAARGPKERKKTTLSFRITNGGRMLRGFNASVVTFCVGPTLDDNYVSIGFTPLPPIRIAPDGTVTGYLATKGQRSELKLTGRLRGRRFRGKIDARISVCSGVRKLDAVRR